MADDTDKVVVYREEDDIQADSTDHQSTSKTQNNPILECNDLIDQIKNKRGEFTTKFMETASKEQLNVKKLETKTLIDLYQAKFKEIDIQSLSKENQTAIELQKKYVENTNKQIEEILNTSRFVVASTAKNILSSLYEKLKNEKEKVTIEYLHNSSLEELQNERSLHSDWYTEFATKFAQIKLADLLQNEHDDLISQKVFVETISPNIDNYLTHEINSRQAKIDPTKGSKNENITPVSEPNKDLKTTDQIVTNLSAQIGTLTVEIERIKQQKSQEKADAEERIKSLEGKIVNQHSEYDFGEPREYYDNYDEQMVGDPADDTEQGMAGIKIGTIQLTTFSGILEEWETFRDLFEHLVHKSKKLTKAVKFYQLRTHLKGEALDTVRGYKVTGSNYEAAWADLTKRYDRTDELIDDYIRKFFEAKPIEYRANFHSLRAIIDTTNQMLRALPNLGANIEFWDPIINLIICSKLNEELRTEWKQKKGRDQKKTIELLDHLENKAIQLQPTQGDRFSQMLKGETRRADFRRGEIRRGNTYQNPPKKVFQVNENKKVQAKKEKAKKECLLCKGNHNIWDCNMLKKETAKVRTSMIKALGLCFKCLLKHRVGMCDNEDCEYCGGPHNILLCFKKDNEEKLKPTKPKNYQPGNFKPNPSTNQQSEDWSQEDWNTTTVQKN